MSDIFVGRQPIYDRQLQVYAYELLFRSDEVNRAGVTDGDAATSEVLIGTVMDIGLETLVGGKPAFINLSQGFLDGSWPMPLSPREVVLEVLEDVPPEPAVIRTLQGFAAAGYTIALDDFVFRPGLEPLMALAHIIKLDVLALSRSALEEHVRQCRGRGLRLLAEKVESHEQFALCRKLGFDYFQGYFLCRPNVVRGERRTANRLAVLQLVARLQDPEVSVGEMEALIARDVGLSFKLLRYINSPFYGLSHRVDSLRQAILLIGTRAIKNWASLILLTRIEGKPVELMLIALIRARMCELLAAHVKNDLSRDQYFTVGLFSTLDAVMDQPMEELLTELPLSDVIKAALLHHQGAPGQVLAEVLAYEQGEWDTLERTGRAPGQYRRAYLEALQWARESFETLEARAA